MTEEEKKTRILKWVSIKHFSFDEFDDPSEKDSGLNMSLSFIEILDSLRDKCGFPFFITSGFRTKEHNAEVGGVEGSAHQSGVACDISVSNGYERDRILRYSYELGIQRRGIGQSLIHLDLDYTKPQGVCWVYQGK